MKKLVLSSLLLFVVSMTYAQKFTFGPYVGGGFAVASAKNDLYSTKAKFNGSFVVGAFARVGIKKFYIQPEVNYGNKTSTFTTSTVLFGNYESTLKTGNVNVNLLLGYKLLDLKAANFRVFVGPTYSYLAAKDLVTKLNGVTLSSGASTIANSSFNIQGGLGLDLTKITIDARYERGLSNLSTSSGTKIAFNNILVTLGFKIL